MANETEKDGNAKAGKIVIMIFRILAFACGVAVAAMGVIGLIPLPDIFQSRDAFVNGITGIVSSFYLLLFGLLICLAEAKVLAVLKYFAFLATFTGVGVFLILVGFLVLGVRIPQAPDVELGLIVGGIVIVLGVFNLIFACFAKKGPKPTFETV